MNQLSLVDVQWSWVSLFVSLFLDCVKFRRKRWKRSFTIETPVYVRCNLPTLYWLRMKVRECFSQTAFYNPVVMLLCPCVCFKPVTLFGVASILCQNFREGHSGISPYIVLPSRQIDHPYKPKAIAFQEWLQKHQTSSNIPLNLQYIL